MNKCMIFEPGVLWGLGVYSESPTCFSFCMFFCFISVVLFLSFFLFFVVFLLFCLFFFF